MAGLGQSLGPFSNCLDRIPSARRSSRFFQRAPRAGFTALGSSQAWLGRSYRRCHPKLLTYSRCFLSDVQVLLDKQKFDLVLINGSDLLWLLSHLPPGIPKILLAHNIEHQLFLSQINGLYAGSRLARGALMRDWRRLRDYEMAGMRQVENIIFLSSQDAEFALAENPDTNVLIVPPMFGYQPPERLGSRNTEAGLQIGFMGNFGWWPNREGLRWFLREVFPHTSIDTRLHLFGDKSREAAPRNPRIVNHGFVPKIEAIWPICDFMICPIHTGGGVNVKFAEAVYNRVPVLATSFGARGLSLQSDPGIVLLDGAAEWVSFLCSPAARALRSRRVAESISDTLAMQSHAEPVQSFVLDVMQRESSH